MSYSPRWRAQWHSQLQKARRVGRAGIVCNLAPEWKRFWVNVERERQRKKKIAELAERIAYLEANPVY